MFTQQLVKSIKMIEEKGIRPELLKLGREIAEYNRYDIFKPIVKYNVTRIGDLMILEVNKNEN